MYSGLVLRLLHSYGGICFYLLLIYFLCSCKSLEFILNKLNATGKLDTQLKIACIRTLLFYLERFSLSVFDKS